MSLFFEFKKLIGFELLESLYKLSNKTKKYYDKIIKEKFNQYRALFTIDKINEINFFNGDFLKQKWNEASIIFINATCFSSNIMTHIGTKINKECQKGAIVVSISKQINCISNDWELNISFKKQMSWGLATIHIYIKRK